MSLQQELLQEERPAAQVRVTAEELAQAIAAVEARDGAAAMAHADTIALGEAVQQLGLQATPEELLSEVKARRQERVDPAVERRKRRRRLLVRAGIALSIAANIFLLISSVTLYGAATAAQHRTSPPTTLTEGTMGEIDLSTLGDRQTAYVDLYTLYDLANGTPTARERGFYYQDVNKLRGAQWELIRLNGKLYVKAWAVRTAEGAYDEVTSVQTSTAPDQAPVTVPVERFGRARDPDKLTSPRFNTDVPTTMQVETVKLAPEKTTN